MDMEVGEDGRNEESREVQSPVSDCTRDDRQTDLAQVARCLEESEGGGSSNNSGSPSPLVTYKDTATWTAEDGMPSPIETSPVSSSPILTHANFIFPADIEPPSAVVLSNSSHKPGKTRTHSSGCHSGNSNSQSQGRHHHHHHQHRQHRRQQKIINPQQLTECFTVSSQLMSREARLYENVPTTASGLENLGILLSEYHPSNSSSSGQLLSHSSNNSNETASTSNNSGKNNSSANLNNELLSVTDLLGVGPPSRTSWADSGRESLSFDGENNNSNGSTKNLLLYPPPPPIPHSVGPGSSNFGNMSSLHHHNCSSPLHMSNNGNCMQSTGGASSSRKSRRDRLVRQKQAIEETFHPIDKIGTAGTGMSQYLAVPSPRKGVISGGMIASNLANAAASPINLQRHPNSAQLLLQENKKSHPLIPCESPYILTATNEWTHGGKMGRNRSPQRGGGASGGTCGNGGGGHSVAARLAKSSGKYHQSFDYGELPSHQMFPKRHLLAQGQRHFSHQLPTTHTNSNGSSHNLGQDTNPGSSGPQQCSGYVPAASGHLAPHQHRSFPAGLFSGVAPRSCSMGDLTSCNSTNGGPCKSPDQIPVSSATTGGITSTVPLVTSLPLPPATSVTYEFSLAPVSGTLAPGWHLTAVQRGLATAVPLAAVVARRRLPRPRPATRPRFGFTDKNEARRAKWTIAITALALLAMSMLLVGVTLRLAPLIDDLVRKENEHLLKVIQQTSVNVTSSSTTTTLLQTDTNVSHNHNNNNLGSSDSYHNSNPTGGQPLPRTTDIIRGVQEDYSLHENDKNPLLNEETNLRSTNTEAFEQSDQDQ